MELSAIEQLVQQAESDIETTLKTLQGRIGRPVSLGVGSGQKLPGNARSPIRVEVDLKHLVIEEAEGD